MGGDKAVTRSNRQQQQKTSVLPSHQQSTSTLGNTSGNRRSSSYAPVPTPLSSELASLLLSSASAVTHSDLTALESNLLSKLGDMLDSKLDACRRSIIADIDLKIEGIKNHLSALDDKINALELKVNECSATSATNRDDILRSQRCSDVVISGVPCVDNENTTELFKKIAGSLNVAASPYVQAFRAKKKNNYKNSNNPGAGDNNLIIAKLSCPAERNALLTAIRQRDSPLTLADLDCGFLSSSKVNIFESLLRQDHAIRSKANRLRKESGIFYSVGSANGFVVIQTEKGKQPIKVTNMKQLDQMVSDLSGA